MRCSVLLALSLVTSLACEDARRGGGVAPPNNPRRDASETQDDASEEGPDSSSDGAVTLDANPMFQPDATLLIDTGVTFPDAAPMPPIDSGFHPDAFVPPPQDAGIPGNSCAALSVCCPNTPAVIMGQCTSTVMSGGEAQCADLLSTLNGLGACNPPSDAGVRDAAPPPRDSGVHRDAQPAFDSSIGGSCADLAGCCILLGLSDPATAQQCLALAQAGLEPVCDLFLAQVQTNGSCPL